jgi:steroid 5-alpha reductase family enzyme
MWCRCCRRFDGFYPKSEDEPWLTGETKFPLKLAGFWVVQAPWAFSVLLPVTVAQAANPTASMGAWGWIGFALFMSCALFEATGGLRAAIACHQFPSVNQMLIIY